MASPVSPNQVATLSVSPLCADQRPCNHGCTITLMDGRKVTKLLNEYDIATLKRNIPTDRIEDDGWHLYQFIERPVTAENILTHLFAGVVIPETDTKN